MTRSRRLPQASLDTENEHWLPTPKLLEAPSGDFAGMNMSEVFEHVYNDRRSGARAPIREKTRSGYIFSPHNRRMSPYDWDRLRSDVAKHGIQEPIATHPDSSMVINGHHRAVMAIEQGHLFVPVRGNVTQESPNFKSYRDRRPQPEKAWSEH